MNTYSVVFSGMLVLVGMEANAAESYAPDGASTSASVRTRADVRQETLKALAAGEVTFGDVDWPAPASTVGSRTRAEVRKELRDAIAAGELSVGDVDRPQVAATGAVERRGMFATRRGSRMRRSSREG